MLEADELSWRQLLGLRLLSDSRSEQIRYESARVEVCYMKKYTIQREYQVIVSIQVEAENPEEALKAVDGSWLDARYDVGKSDLEEVDVAVDAAQILSQVYERDADDNFTTEDPLVEED